MYYFDDNDIDINEAQQSEHDEWREEMEEKYGEQWEDKLLSAIEDPVDLYCMRRYEI